MLVFRKILRTYLMDDPKTKKFSYPEKETFFLRIKNSIYDKGLYDKK